MMTFRLGCCDVFTIFHGFTDPEMTKECPNCKDSMTALKTETFVLNSPKCLELFEKYKVYVVYEDP